MRISRDPKAFDFVSECNDVLRTIASRPYRDTIRHVDALERRATLAVPDQDPRLSCADLRLDAALHTGQPASECEARYNELVQCGADATFRLLKLCFFVRVVREASEVSMRRLQDALADAVGEAPPELVATANRLLDEIAANGKPT
jgi:hypothetical protein